MAKVKLQVPKISCYGPYSGNYGSNALHVDFGDVELFFSYQTLIAFRVSGVGMVIRKNSWGPTTGKHLNCIDTNKKIRVDFEEFEKLWRKHVANRFLGSPKSEDVRI